MTTDISMKIAYKPFSGMISTGHRSIGSIINRFSIFINKKAVRRYFSNGFLYFNFFAPQ